MGVVTLFTCKRWAHVTTAAGAAGEEEITKKTTSFLQRLAWASATEAAEDDHGEAAHASLERQDGHCCSRFCTLVAVLDSHLDGIGVLDPDAWRLLAWDVGHTKEVEQGEKEEVMEEMKQVEEVEEEVEKVEKAEEAEEVESNASPPPWRHMHDYKFCNSM